MAIGYQTTRAAIKHKKNFGKIYLQQLKNIIQKVVYFVQNPSSKKINCLTFKKKTWTQALVPEHDQALPKERQRIYFRLTQPLAPSNPSVGPGLHRCLFGPLLGPGLQVCPFRPLLGLGLGLHGFPSVLSAIPAVNTRDLRFRLPRRLPRPISPPLPLPLSFPPCGQPWWLPPPSQRYTTSSLPLETPLLPIRLQRF